jgi:hypothetical protein
MHSSPRVDPTHRIPLISLEIEIALHVPDREDESELRANAENLGLKATQPIAGAAVASDLFIGIPYQPHLKLFGQELRRAPIEVQVDAVLILGRRVEQIVG